MLPLLLLLSFLPVDPAAHGGVLEQEHLLVPPIYACSGAATAL
jgi:hypothetical protein